MKQVDSGEQHHSLTTFTWDALKENSKQAKTLWNNFRRSDGKNYQARTNGIFRHGPTIWNVMQRNAWIGVTSWDRTTQQL